MIIYNYLEYLNMFSMIDPFSGETDSVYRVFAKRTAWFLETCQGTRNV
jgi:hypothetical protein